MNNFLKKKCVQIGENLKKRTTTIAFKNYAQYFYFLFLLEDVDFCEF